MSSPSARMNGKSWVVIKTRKTFVISILISDLIFCSRFARSILITLDQLLQVTRFIITSVVNRNTRDEIRRVRSVCV